MLNNKKYQFLFYLLGIYFFSTYLFAKEQIISPIPSPEEEVINISIEKCSKSCLIKLFDAGQYFSFLAFYSHSKNTSLQDKFQIANAMINSSATILEPSNPEIGVKIALLIPQKKIGRYSITSADSILAYLIAHGDNFDFKVFDSQNEEVKNLTTTYNAIQKEGYDYIIAILTPQGLGNLLQNVTIDIPLFVPTINQKQATSLSPNKNVFFGGIDYEKQLKMITTFAESKNVPLMTLNDDDIRGKMLGEILNSMTQNLIFKEVVDTKKSTNFRDTLAKMRGSIKKSIVVLNTSVIKSGLIVPQIGNTKNMPLAFLSSQINYNPSLLGLMPQEDSQKLYIVNMINPLNIQLLAFSELMSADLQYDWINYATALATDILLTHNTKAIRFFNEKLQNNQIIYNDRFYGVKDSHFIPVKLK